MKYLLVLILTGAAILAALLLAGCQTPSSSQWCVGACTQVTPPAQQATIPPVKKEE